MSAEVASRSTPSTSYRQRTTITQRVTQNPARERRTYSKSSKRQRGVTQKPARERRSYSKSSKREKEVFKIQQEREALIQNPAQPVRHTMAALIVLVMMVIVVMAVGIHEQLGGGLTHAIDVSLNDKEYVVLVHQPADEKIGKEGGGGGGGVVQRAFAEEEEAAGRRVTMMRHDGVEMSCSLQDAPKSSAPSPHGNAASRDGGGNNDDDDDDEGGRQSDNASTSALGKGKWRDQKAKRLPLSQLLKPLDGACFIRIEGWWTYELCFGKHMRQFHTEGDQVTNDIMLGRYDASTPVRNVDETEDGDGVYEDIGGAMAKVIGGASGSLGRYTVHYYNEGTPCDIGSQSTRSVEVRLYCGKEKSRTQNFIEAVHVRHTSD